MSLARRFVSFVVSRVLPAALAWGFLAVSGLPAHAQVQPSPQTLLPGRNVNMVSGTQWPNGDPYLQRQNEPSVAASTRNPLHLLAGANDYRTVDIPFVAGAGETGDAWLGIFKSFDGGQRWQTNLLPGYPQDMSPEGLASPLKGYQAGADPVVRPGTSGLLYYAGIVFDRVENGRSAVFVSRFIDNNNKENGDPISYLGTSVVATSAGGEGGAFIDKPWMAVDIPRAGARLCAIPVAGSSAIQRVRAGNIYVAYALISGSGASFRSTIMFTTSSDCGERWTRPVAISSPSDPVNQGATLAIHPRTGAVSVAWRVFGLNGATDAMMVAQASGPGRPFQRFNKVRRFLADHSDDDVEKWLTRKKDKRQHRERDDDRGRSADRRRDDDDDRGRIARENRSKREQNRRKSRATLAEAAGEAVPFDQATQDIDDPYALAFRTNSYPTMTFDGNGRAYLAWTERGFAGAQAGDARVVISTSIDGVNWTPRQVVEDPADADSGAPAPGHQLMPSITFGGGRIVLLYYDLREDASRFFGEFIDDKSATVGGTGRRHTLDLRASFGSPGATPVFEPSIRVSEYLSVMKRDPGTGSLYGVQAQFNPPNLPMFKLGTAPFMGDYVDVALAPAFVPTANGGWTYNTNGAQPVFHAVWTDNRDVRQPAAGTDGRPDWTKYTPPLQTQDGSSRFDPTQSRPVCDPNLSGSRNQNIYTARLTAGLLVGSPGNAKPLSTSLQRAFVVFAQNTGPVTKVFRMTIDGQPAGGRASFTQFGTAVTSIDVTTPPRSMASRSVYVTSSNPDAQIRVDVEEVGSIGGAIVAGGLSDVIVLNPDIANPDIANPDIANPDIANPDIANPDIANASLTDVTWTMTNNGNTTAAFNVNLFLAQQTNKICGADPSTSAPDCITTQLILRKVYNTPITGGVQQGGVNGCAVQVQSQNILLANIANPRFVTPGQSLPDQNDPSAENATVWLAPGETAKITLRVYDPHKYDNVAPTDSKPETPTDPDGYLIDPLFLPTTTTEFGSVTPVVQQQSVDTADIVAAGGAGSPVPPVPPVVTPLSDGVPPVQTPTATMLAFVAQPTSVGAGAPMPPVSVTVRDQYGAPLDGALVTLFLATNPANALLSGATAPSVGGTATFSALTVGSAGIGFTLAATAGTALPAVSNAFTVTANCDPLVVTTTEDTGLCGSLRFAIATANTSAGTITFEIAEPTPHVITPTSLLPAVASGVVIDATTDPHYLLSGGQPVVQISGANFAPGSVGLALTGTGSTVKGIEFNGFTAGATGPFTAAGVLLGGGGGHTVTSSHFGMIVPNYTGILVTSSNNTIGGTTANAGNVVGGSGQEQGIWIQGEENNRIEGNFVGNNGVNAFGNGVGIRITGGASTVIGGTAPGARNVISGNGVGILLAGGTATEIRGNYVGLDAAGTAAIANSEGITAFGPVENTVIQGNWIAGNNRWGIDIQHSGSLAQVAGTRILANTLGLDSDGAELGNGWGGVRIQNAPGTIVGAPPVAPEEPSRGNVISGNGGHAILVQGDGTEVTIQANRIGTNPAGDSARPNGPIGGDFAAVMIDRDVSGVQIGGDSTLGEGNLISGNSAYGIKIWGTGNSVFGNFIGTNATGTAALANTKFGIHVEIGPGNVIGGTGPGQRNVIAGNGLSGIALTGQGSYAGAVGTVITGNLIGLNAAGTATLSNAGAGIDIREGASGIITGNTISGNAGAGVAVWQGATGTTISANSLFANGGLGIDLQPLGAATGAPVLSNVTTAGFDYAIPGGAGTYTIEVFTSSTCDPSGYGEGQVALGTFGGSGSGPITTALPLGSVVTVTATNGAGTTEFSNCAVAKAIPVITWAAPAAIAVGTPLGGYELNATANVAGTFVYTPALGTVLPVGTHGLSVTFTPSDTASYHAATAAVTLVVVGPAPGHVLVPAVAGGLANTNCQPSCAEFSLGPGGTAPVNTGMLLNAGGSVTLTATGQVVVGGDNPGPYGPSGTGSAGTYWPQWRFLSTTLNQFSLVARIGSGPWQFVGPGPTVLTASGAGGELQLAVNDSGYADNRGWFDVTIGGTSTGVFVPGTAGGTARALSPAPCPSCGPGGPGGIAPVDSGIVLALNEVVTVSASGSITYYLGSSGVSPDGAEVGRVENLVSTDNWGGATASLFARVGAGGWQYVGSGPTQIVAYQAGTLELAVNDSNYADNGGGWNVTVTRPALPTATVTPSGPFSAVFDGNAKSVAFTTTPGGLGLDVQYNGGGQPSDIGAYFVRAKVTGGVRAGAGSAILTVASTLTIGGGGGGPYERSCGPGVATGFGANNGSSYGLLNAWLQCEGGGATERFVLDNTQPNSLTSACPAGQIMVGFHGYQGLSDGTAGPFVKALGARCQDRSGVGPVSSIPVIGNTDQTYVGPYDCPSGQAVVGVVGGAGGVLDSTALVCAAIPTTGTITSMTPSSGATGQWLVARGTTLPTAPRVIVSNGTTTADGTYVPSPSNASVAYFELPAGFPLGAATVRFSEGTALSTAYPITVASVPGTPVITGVFADGGGLSPTTSFSVGQTIYVRADGIRSLSGLLFSQGSSTWEVDNLYNGTSNQNGTFATFVVPGGPAAGPISISVRQMYTYASPWSAYSAPWTGLTIVP